MELTGLDPHQLKLLVQLLPTLPPEKREEVAALVRALTQGREIINCRDDFLAFVRKMWPTFIAGAHHKKMADVFERVARGELKRVTISMPPRHTKSEFASYLFPAWFLGKYPEKKIIQASHTAELSVNFGRKVRNLVGSEAYREIFPDVGLKADSKAAGRWNTNKGGDYYAVGVGGALAGHGGDIVIIDDPHDEQEAISAGFDPSVFDKVYDWYTTGPRQRLQPGGAIVIVQTRWGKKDLVGRVIASAQERGADSEWEVIEFPAILPSGKPLWPEFWSLPELENIKRDIPPARWNAQYMQQPTSEGGALVKREWWRRWDGPPPPCEFVVQSWDTAHRKTQRSDFSVCTTWGVFRPPGDERPNVILLGLHRERMEFPELKKEAMKQYKEWSPDSCIIEGKAAGDALIQELRSMGYPLQSYTPSRGEDKIVRVNAVADLFASGAVWAPTSKYVPGVEELIEEFSDFPNGAHDDMVDASTLALMRFRQGNFIRLFSDEEEEDLPEFKADYY